MDLAALPLIALLGTLIQSGLGFGFGLFFVPVAALFVAPREAVAVSLLLGTTVSAGMYLEARPRTGVRAILPLVVGALIGMPVGVWILVRADETVLRLLVAVAVFVSAVANLAGGNGHTHQARPDPLMRQGLVGILGGVIRGATSMGGPPIVLYQHWIGGGAERIRGRLFAYFFWVGVPATLIVAPSGVFTHDVLRGWTLALPALAVGLVAGRLIRPHIAEAWFGRLSMLLLAMTSALAAWGAVRGILG